MAANKRATFKSVLVDVGKEIPEDDARDLARECTKIKGAERAKIRTGGDLVAALEKVRFLSQDNVDDFVKLLENRDLFDAADILKKYKQEHINIPTSNHGGRELSDDCDRSNSSGSSGVSGTRRQVDMSLLQSVAGRITAEWLDVGRNLKISEPTLQQNKADTRNDSRKEAIFQMLLIWYNEEGERATYEVLAAALQASGRGDLAQYVLKQA